MFTGIASVYFVIFKKLFGALLTFYEHINAGVKQAVLDKSVMPRVSFDLGSGSRLSLPAFQCECLWQDPTDLGQYLFW